MCCILLVTLDPKNDKKAHTLVTFNLTHGSVLGNRKKEKKQGSSVPLMG